MYSLTDPEMERFVTGRAPDPTRPQPQRQVPTMAKQQGEKYVAEETVYRDLGNGVQEQVIAKGAAIPMDLARTLGLVKDGQQVGPTEIKAGVAPSDAAVDAQAAAANAQTRGDENAPPPHVMHDQMRAATAPDPEQALKEPSATGTTSTPPGVAADEPTDDGKAKRGKR